MPTPIFIIGWGSSGTTWLSNLLLEHPAIVGIQHEKHWGIHESAFFSVVEGRYGNLDDPANFVEFAQVMVASDYFRLAGADATFLYSLYPASYAEVFQKAMDHYATELHATYWVEKTPLHTLHAESIARYYPDASFIAIVRNVNTVVASRIRLLERWTRKKGVLHYTFRKWFLIAIWVMTWQHYNNVIRRFAERYPVRTMTVTYEELTTRTESVMRNVCKFLSLEFKPAMLQSRYSANSSFRLETPDARHKALTPQEKLWLNMWKVLADIVPEKVLSSAYKLGAYIYNKRRTELPRWFFSLLPNAPQALFEKLSVSYRKDDKK